MVMSDSNENGVGRYSDDFQRFVEQHDTRLHSAASDSHRRFTPSTSIPATVRSSPVTGPDGRANETVRRASPGSDGIEYEEDMRVYAAVLSLPETDVEGGVDGNVVVNAEEDRSCDDEMVDGSTVDGDQPVDFRSSRITHPPPVADDGVFIEDDPILYGNVPWFYRGSLNDEAQIRLCARDGSLPGNIPAQEVFAVCWHNQYACYCRDFRVPRGRTLKSVQASFAGLAMSGFNRLLTYQVCDPSQTGMFIDRTRGDDQYLRNLAAIPESSIEGWRSWKIVAADALCFPGSLLVMEFRFKRKSSSYWNASVRNERRRRLKHGYALLYQCLNTFGFRGEYFQPAFPRLTSGWAHIEVPRGCLAEIPPVFTYKSEELKKDDSGWWVVAFTEMTAKTAAFVLFDAYDQFRLWALSPLMIQFIQTLDLVVVLGNRQNADELLEMLERIFRTDYSALPSAWSSRGGGPSASPGSDGPGADYAWYDPYERKFIGVDAAMELLTRVGWRCLVITRRVGTIPYY